MTREARTPNDWHRKAPLVLVALAIGFNLWVLRAERMPLPNLNDSAVHYLDVLRASEALANGENPFDHWLPVADIVP